MDNNVQKLKIEKYYIGIENVLHFGKSFISLYLQYTYTTQSIFDIVVFVFAAIN